MVDNKENKLCGYPNAITYECSKKIIEQMDRNICKINYENIQGTGFFCKIPFPNQKKYLPVLITNNHIINSDLFLKKNVKIQLDIKSEQDLKEIILKNRIKYTNEEYDTTIIELKEEDNINNYLELDDIIINDILNNINKTKEYINETIYAIQYPDNKLSVSYGVLENIYADKKYEFQHKCSTKVGSSGSPLLNINNKIIGIHKEGYSKYNIGTFISYPIKDFIECYNNKQNFNKKYKLKISDTKTNLDLEMKYIGNEGLIDLCKIKFNKLKKLIISYNDISDIKVLENAKFDKLEYLDLSINQISDINILEKVNFKGLKEIKLGLNQISDIKVLEKVKFDKLEILNLSGNQISDINILEKVNFKRLKELYLNLNNISDIQVFGKVKFDKLEILDLTGNQILKRENESIISKLKSKIKKLNI